jgi:hypothetical protein
LLALKVGRPTSARLLSQSELPPAHPRKVS